mmetsp:Transcript_11703/g.12084  ORF Transcript_11703/g.12084 Transcript_11703/m.12084 type:complete len:1355 (+) Transcript_11703:40-4104(+)
MSLRNKFRSSIQNNNIIVLKECLEKEPLLVNDRGLGEKTALILAVIANKCESVKVLLEFGADQSLFDNNDKTAYDYASEYNRVEILPLLKPNFTSRGYLKDAIEQGNVQKCRDLIRQDPNLLNRPDEEGTTPLIQAVKRNNSEIVQLLIGLIADQSPQDRFGRTAYDYASLDLKQYLDSKYSTRNVLRNFITQNDSAGLREYLKNDSSGIDEQNNDGITPLIYAVQLKHLECVQVLLDFRADQSIENHSNQTAYDLSEGDIRGLLNPSHSTFETIKKLIWEGNHELLNTVLQNSTLNINSQDNEFGYTPLMYAIIHNQPTCMKVVLDYNPDQSIKNNRKQTAYDLASRELRRELNPAYSTIYNLDPNIALRIGTYVVNKEYILVDTNRTKNPDRLIFGSFYEPIDYEQVNIVIKKYIGNGNLKTEIDLLSNESSRLHLLKKYYVHGTKENPEYLVVEEFGKDLRNYNEADLNVRHSIILELLRAVNAVHELNYMHGNIQPKNILVSEVNPGIYKCKLTGFDNTVKLSNDTNILFPRTSSGEYLFSKLWVAPEVYSGFVEQRNILASKKIDTFSVALVIDWYSSVNVSKNQSILDELIHNNNYPTQKQLYSSCQSIRNDHPFGIYVKEMLSIDPNLRKAINIYLDAVNNCSLLTFYHELKKHKRELQIYQERQISDEKLDRILKEVGATQEQIQAVHSKLNEVADKMNNFAESMENFRSTTNNLTNALTDLKYEFIAHHKRNDENLRTIIETIESRINILKDINVSSLADLLQASLISKLNTTLVDILNSHTETVTQHLKDIENELKLQDEDVNDILSKIDSLSNNQDDLKEQCLVFKDIAHIPEKINSIVDSLATKDEIKLFYDQYNQLFSEHFQERIRNISENFYKNDSKGGNVLLQDISNHFTNLRELITNSNNQNETVIKQTIQSELIQFQTNLTERVSKMEILAQTNADIITKFDNSKNIQSQLDNLTQQVKDSNSTAASIPDDEFKKFVESHLTAIRNHQIFNAHKLFKYPPLFIIVREKVKDTRIANALNTVKEAFITQYRLYFCCSVCGKAGNTGEHKSKEESKNFILQLLENIENAFTTGIENQGGYSLSETNSTVMKALDYLGSLLFALEIATAIVGVPAPKFSKLLDNLPKSKRLTKSVNKLYKNQFSIYQKVVDSGESNLKAGSIAGETKNALKGSLPSKVTNPSSPLQTPPIDYNTISLASNDSFSDDESDGNDNDDDNDNDGTYNDDNNVTDINYKELTDTQKDQIKEYWKRKKPRITNEHMNIVQQLFTEVKDPQAFKVGLRRCINEGEGRGVWVCKEDYEYGNDNDTKGSGDPECKSCYELYKEQGSKCCLFDVTSSLN